MVLVSLLKFHITGSHAGSGTRDTVVRITAVLNPVYLPALISEPVYCRPSGR